MSFSTLTATVDGTHIDLDWDAEGGASYYAIFRKQTGEGYSRITNVTDTAYEDTDVNFNTIYTYYIQAYLSTNTSDAASATLGWSDTISETCTCTETVEAGLDYTDTLTETCTVTDAVDADRIRMVDYGFYLGGIYVTNGYLFLYSDAYGEDYTTDIVSYYQTKKLDFSDQYPQHGNAWKTVHRVRLYYVDRGITSVTIYLSTDGGVTWETQTKTTGTAGATGNGDGVVKTADFYFIKTGMFFNIKVERVSLDTDSTNEATSQWCALEVEFEPRADYFEVS